MEQSRLDERIAALEDLNAIATLKWRYLRACDRKDVEAVRSCFAPDAVIDYEGFPLFTDPESFVETFRQLGCRPNIIDMHHGQNPVIELTAPGAARGGFDCYFFQIDTDTRRQVQLAVSYDDEFVRAAGVWRISRSVSRRRSMLVQEIGEDTLVRIAVAARSDQPGPPPAARA
jgi:hypothetical protein